MADSGLTRSHSHPVDTAARTMPKTVAAVGLTVSAERTGIGRLLADLNAQGIGVRDVATTQSSLEEVFMSLLENGAEARR